MGLQLKADKGKYYTISFSDSGDMNDTVINIHGANLVQAIGDISCLYVGRTDFASATRLRSIQIGSMATGYSNPNLTEVSFGTNKMLEYLYIQNCPNVAQSLDLTGCQALRELDIRGSGFTGVSFALGGLIEKAYLCSPAALNMRSLYHITDSDLTLESYNNLTSLRLEDCNGIDSFALVNLATNLARVRILGIDWSIADTTVLNRMLLLLGLDENNYNVDTSVLTGSVYVSGSIRNQELLNYGNAWENLNITYNADNLVTQHLVQYVNDDDEETVLYEYYADQGSAPIDPVATGDIPNPTLASTAQYDFTFSSWENIDGDVIAPRVIKAKYSTKTRLYTVTWYSRAGLPLKSKTVEYGSEAIYDGDTPTNTSGESAYIYNVFAGWDKSTGYIRENTDVYAIWERAELPALGKDLKNMTEGEIFAITTAKRASEYFEDKDYFDIEMGHDFNFSNVKSDVLVGKDATNTSLPLDSDGNLFLNGKTGYATDIQLFGENEESFTMAIDFRFADNTTNNTLVSCYDESGSEGFRLRFNSNPNIQWGDRSTNVGNFVSPTHYRDIVVIRHRKGENRLYVYSNYCQASGSRFFFDTQTGSNVVKVELIRSRETHTNTPISFGGVRFADGNYDYCAKGVIHWCKVWYDDLGDAAAEQLATWCHEPLRIEYCGTERYRLAGSTSLKCNASFIANNAFAGRGFWMNTTNVNAGGWDQCLMRKFCNNKVFAGLPTVWQSMIKAVKINASAGNMSSELVVSEDKVYLASNREMGGWTSEPYASEGQAISWFTTNAKRIKFRGRIVSDDASFYTADIDPSQYSSYHVKPGDIWINTSNDSRGYMYVTQDELDKYGITPDIQASIGGGWVIAYYWWERSPFVSGTTGFCYVYYGGYPSGTYYATNVIGVCPCFSL